MGMIKRFLGNYSENFFAAVALWPVASLAFTLPILAYLYHRDGRLRFTSIVITYLAVLYVLGLGCFTLYPLPQGTSGLGITYGVPWQLNPFVFVDDFLREGISTIPQIAFNVVLFMPLGFITGRFLRLGFLSSVLIGCGTSLLIEAAQGTGLFGIYPYAYRMADIDDVLYNTTGALLGWLAARASRAIVPEGALADEDTLTYNPGFVRRSVALWLDMMLVWLVTLIISGVLVIALHGSPGVAQVIEREGSLTIPAVAFVVVEAIYPWFYKGSTPGGRFVRMSFETHKRLGVRRVVFFVVRLVVLGGICLLMPFAGLFMLVFYLIFRQMPYDYL